MQLGVIKYYKKSLILLNLLSDCPVIKILKSFAAKLQKQVDYIAKDKLIASRKFKKDVLKAIKTIPNMPYKNRKSIYFNDVEIRDLIFKGYKIVYRINNEEYCIEVFGFIKYENTL